ncbi:MAG: flagellar protein FliS [Rhodospirillaceae bacterium]|nr:flagellar protein FliS [Rhodospirillaceae bacterium]
MTREPPRHSSGGRALPGPYAVASRAAAAAAYGTARRTLSPLQIVVELYDRALTAVAHARAARDHGTPEPEFQALTAAVRILRGLDGCLLRSDSRAPAVSATLHDYYDRVVAQLYAAQRTRGAAGTARYASVHTQISTMREAWAELAGVPSLKVPPRQDLPGAGQILPGSAQKVPADRRISTR